MLHYLENDGGFVALKWAAEDRERYVKNLLNSRRLLILVILPFLSPNHHWRGTVPFCSLWGGSLFLDTPTLRPACNRPNA